MPEWRPDIINQSRTSNQSSEAMIPAVMNAILAIEQRSLKNSGSQRGLNP